MIIREIKSLCAGNSHACAVFDTSEIKCWGNAHRFGKTTNTLENIGDSLNEVGDNLPFLNIESEPSITHVSCGGFHVCMRLATGTMKCIGNNDLGQVGIGLATLDVIGIASGHVGDSLPLVNLGNSLLVLEMALGYDHTCARLSGNKVKCFGNNNVGQLGYEHNGRLGWSPSQMGESLQFVNLGTSVEISSIYSSCNSKHSCVILSAPVAVTQRMKCWGSNINYELGYGTIFNVDNRGDAANEMGDRLPVIDLGTESRVKLISLGESSTCALLVSDALKCWGKGSFGQLGSGSTNSISAIGNAVPFVSIDIGMKVKHMVSGSQYSCIVYDDELAVKCFGYNIVGQLGQGDMMNRGDTPSTTIPYIPVLDLGTISLKIKFIRSGSDFTCIVFVDNSMKCFGSNNAGQCLVGNKLDIGNEPEEMGSNLDFAILFSPTSNPTKAPSIRPSKLPTIKPTKQPTIRPTTKPTEAPIPPTLPTNSPSSFPTLTPIPNPTANSTTSPTIHPTQEEEKEIDMVMLAIILAIANPLLISIACLFYQNYKRRRRKADLNTVPVAISVNPRSPISGLITDQ